MPSENIFIARPTRKGLAFFLSTKTEEAKMTIITIRELAIKPIVVEPVDIINTAERKAERFIAPSINTANVPVYSVSNAPSIAKSRGELDLKIAKSAFFIF